MGVSPMRGMAVPAMQRAVFRAKSPTLHSYGDGAMALRRMAKMAMPRKNDFYHGLLDLTSRSPVTRDRKKKYP